MSNEEAFIEDLDSLLERIIFDEAGDEPATEKQFLDILNRYEKEIRDYGLNLFGMYGRKVKLSHSEMIEDNKKDLAVNDHGLTCPSTTDCSDRCSDYINPEHKKTIKALQDAGYLK